MNFLKKNSFFLSLTTIVLFVHFFSSYTEQLLRYERPLIIDGELWRIVSAHVVHGSWEHLWLNLVGLLIIWMLFNKLLNAALWWLFTFLCTIGISTTLFIFMEHLEWYVGLSGVLHSMLVFGAIAGVIKGRKEFILLLFIIFAKILFEQMYGSNSSEILENIVIVNAHLYGAVFGCIIGFGLFVSNNKTNQE